MASRDYMSPSFRQLQREKNSLEKSRNRYRDLYYELRTENIMLKAKIDDETNREWSPVWLRKKLAATQTENEELKKYIIALEEKRNYKEVIF